ncbi:MAG TPA: undecaprenyldiphospho-muramoylpentapeptide beta-N-acetylglucosaminyltransferase [Bryobacteraceae bacterium]|jgi:UDP-N-acetylglucosamine--N-acetylmuramyl-(pentapeptide) pyrophosphoryl-undecaprenol N-acetylglucosamine transferase|nr:undecaprenyldiphospho-muramoylpentapeptide beta-N-acetylglucosaminyltransferase [Bryobacteraceae bacterium]
MPFPFVLVGGGTGGHIYPVLAVGNALRERGHKLLFIGTPQGMEARIIPEHGFEMAFVKSGGLNRVGLQQRVRTAAVLPMAVLASAKILRTFQPRAVFSMGGYVAGPVTLAALLERIPLIVMEPNAVPGAANRWVGRGVYRALVGFEETARFFPQGRAEVIGLPVRAEFFRVQRKAASVFTVLITGGSRGARTLNRAARESWGMFREAKSPIRIVHQTGTAEHAALASEFAQTGLQGEVVPFLNDMPKAFAEADLVIARAGASTIGELAAAGMPSVLVPFPFAADDHQRKNAEAVANAGGARMVLDQEFAGRELFEQVEDLRARPAALEEMRERVRRFARPGAAERAAQVLEEAAERKRS